MSRPGGTELEVNDELIIRLGNLCAFLAGTGDSGGGCLG